MNADREEQLDQLMDDLINDTDIGLEFHVSAARSKYIGANESLDEAYAELQSLPQYSELTEDEQTYLDNLLDQRVFGD